MPQSPGFCFPREGFARHALHGFQVVGHLIGPLHRGSQSASRRSPETWSGAVDGSAARFTMAVG